MFEESGHVRWELGPAGQLVMDRYVSQSYNLYNDHAELMLNNLLMP